MKKVVTLFLCLTGIIISNLKTLSAQAFEDGKSAVAVGYGFGVFGQASEYEYSVQGPVYAKYEYGLSDKIGIGVNLAYIKSTSKYANYYGAFKDEYTSFSGLLRVNSHFVNKDKLDMYWGAGFGYRMNKLDQTDFNGTQSSEPNSNFPIGFEISLGVRVLFLDNLGAYTEVGFTKSVVQLGLSVKF